MKKPMIAAALACLCGAAQSWSEEQVHWSYSGERGPEHWGKLSEEFAACRVGKNQSPIDIRTDSTLKAALPSIRFDYPGEATSIINNGHTLQVNVGSGNALTADGQSFELQQFHFHSPSEHQIDGEAFPLEAHFVHQNAAGELAVVSLLFRSGEENSYLKVIGEAAPRKAGEQLKFEHSLKTDLIHHTPEVSSYYRYSGSLTTPPCSEGLRWFVIPTAATISPEQVSHYIELIGQDARGPQPLNARIVLHSK